MRDFDFGIDAGGKLKALLLILLAIFMSALAVGIVGAPMNMHPVLGYLLKAFILLVFGGIAAGCIISAFHSASPGPDVVPEALERCLTCGEKTPNEDVCPVCAEPPAQRSAAFSVRSESIIGAAIVSIILAGVACLGLFIMIGPYLDGERRIWALIAFFALGLLMFAVGMVGVFGLVVTLIDVFRGTKDISYACKGPDRYSHGSGKVAWRKLVWMQGQGNVRTPLSAQGRSEGGYRFSPGDMALAEAIATFDAAGFFDLIDTTSYIWRVGDTASKTRSGPLELHRTVNRRVVMLPRSLRNEVIPFDDDEDAPAPQDTSEELPADTNILRFLSRFFDEPMDLGAFKAKMDADPIHRTQAEMHARVLRDRGIIPAGELVQAILEAMVRS